MRKFVYYESIKRKLNKRLTFDSWCDARLKAKAEGCTREEREELLQDLQAFSHSEIFEGSIFFSKRVMHTCRFRVVVLAGLLTLGRTFAPPSLAKLNGLRPAAAGSNCWKFRRHQVCPKQEGEEAEARDEGVEKGLKLVLGRLLVEANVALPSFFARNPVRCPCFQEILYKYTCTYSRSSNTS